MPSIEQQYQNEIDDLRSQIADLEKQLDEACAQAFKGAASIIRRAPRGTDLLDIAAALERAASGKAQTVESFEIHNRFCGENGEPCQVCRLKAEREAGEK